MEKFLVSVCALILPITAYAQQPSGQGEEVSLQVTIFNPDEVLGGGHKSPVRPPYVTLDDHTLYLWSQHGGYTLTLLDDNDTVVYQTYVAAGVQFADLPSTLSGSFTLILSDDTYMYIGSIGLE